MDEAVDQMGAHYDAEAIDQLRADYDAVPYESQAFPASAPGNLAAVAYLFGLDTPAVSSARVLEIGCASGGNLIPFAACHSDAQAVGIDLSPVQIDQGRRRVQALGLSNLELIQGDIAAMDVAALGQFDYIICHGVYGWVPDNVQEVILSAVDGLLAPDGVAYLSYNTYPGWKAKEILRDAMLLRVGGRETPEEKVRYARGMIDFLQEFAPADGVLARALADYKAGDNTNKDYYLLHEELETFNTPYYFLELLTDAAEHGLAYLADADPKNMFPANYDAKLAERLSEECGQNQLLIEQYLDFVVNRAFRTSLLVHAERAPQIHYTLDRSRNRRLHFAAWLPSIDTPTRLDDSRQDYGVPNGVMVKTQDPVVKAALDAVSTRWPGTLSWQELLNAVQARVGGAGIEVPNLEARIDELLEMLIVRGLIGYRLDPVLPQSTSAWQLDESARRMAEVTRGDPDACTFNRWHETVPLTPVASHLLPLLDGTRDRDALVEALLALARVGVIQFEPDGKHLRDAVAEYIDELPKRLVATKLLHVIEHAEPDSNRASTVRTDNDSWDITESVGATALGVAAARAAETASENPLIMDPFARLFLDAAGEGVWNFYSGGPLPDELVDVDPDLPVRMKALGDYMAARTKYFDDFFLNATQSGVRQAVILGSGLDARAWRLPWPDGITVYEIDQPKVLEFRSSTLRGRDVRPTANQIDVAIDLREDWPKALCEAGFDPSAPSAWLAEGLLPFLRARAQDALFENISELSAAGSRVAVEAVGNSIRTPEHMARQAEQLQRLRAAAERCGTELPDLSQLWYVEERNDVADWLREHGWDVSVIAAADLMSRYGRTAPTHVEDSFPPSVFVSAERNAAK